MKSLKGKVALVTGGTRNLGKGIAVALGEAGATVYVTGRSITNNDVTGIIEAGGKGIAVVCNHENDDEVKTVFEQIEQNEGRLDLLVNNAWGGYNRLRNRKKYAGFKWKNPFLSPFSLFHFQLLSRCLQWFFRRRGQLVNGILKSTCYRITFSIY
ncbi:MAG: SDR family NAD(P)-dependent oxidoreductase [Cyclobacteriaceae bacterium]